MSASKAVARLAPREREVAELVCRAAEASAVEVERGLSGPISNSAVRTMLGRLVEKGVLRRRRQGRKYIYLPALPDLTGR